MTESGPDTSERSVLDDLRATALRARAMNWSPYTGAVVMAAVRTTRGHCFGGSNVEVANISLSKHAEESAVLMAMAAGALTASGPTERQFIAAVYTTATPCGSCRQFLLEFATDDCIVYIDDDPPTPYVTRFADLLPRPYGPDQQMAQQQRGATP